MRRYRVQIRPDRSLTVEAADQVSATMTALLWARENGEDLFIDRMSESVIEIEPGPGLQGPTSIALDALAPGMGESDVGGPGDPIGRLVLGSGLGLPGFPEIPGLWKRLTGD